MEKLKKYEVTTTYYNTKGVPNEETGVKGSVYTVVAEVKAKNKEEAIEKHRKTADRKYGANSGLFDSATAYEAGSLQTQWFK